MAGYGTPTSSVMANGSTPGVPPLYFVSTQMSPEVTKASFCNRDNVAQCIAYINEEMTSLGFPSIYSESQEINHQEILIQLTNCCYELIQKHQKDLRALEEQETRQMKVNSDYNHLHARLKEYKEKLDQTEKDNISLAEQCRQLTNQITSLQSKVKSAKEETKRTESLLKGRDTQFRHDLKKKERELSKLKEKVHQLLTDKNQERRIGMDILNSIQRADGKRGTWKTGKSGLKHEEEMYRLIVTNYEERQQELMMENQELRESLSNMQKELVDLLNRQLPEKQDSVMAESCDFSETTSLCSSVEELSTGHFQMPFEMVREGIESSLRQKCQKLKEHIEQIEKENRENKENLGGEMKSGEESAIIQYEADTKASLEKEIQRLKTKLKSYRDVIEQQENAMQSSQYSGMEDSTLTDIIRDSHFLEEKEMLSKDKRLFEQQKKNFEELKRNFTDAAIRLGQERKRFEEEKSAFLHQQMASGGPYLTSPTLRPPRSINTSVSPQNNSTPSSLTKVSPVIVTPSHLISNRTPSTQELYRALKLVPDGGDCLNSSQDSLNSIGQRSVRSDVSKSSLCSDRSRNGSTTPRSARGPPSSANSSRKGSINGDTPERRSTTCKRERLEEHKKNLRKTMAQRNTKKASGGTGGRKV
ncbi:Afadin- and alpha-actinin-binding protein B [Holothuria leucospilota]|uniref:Afadin- and alpha-actinin-binding protein B n=1 Tax=Holothuria leucospilota TaxID=206669 RepID=A0A9Q1C928_HOLLE|nr:Afadin- and alpha-actinin-binding protein B [Holothuria leucospilota]